VSRANRTARFLFGPSRLWSFGVRVRHCVQTTCVWESIYLIMHAYSARGDQGTRTAGHGNAAHTSDGGEDDEGHDTRLVRLDGELK
jgi:hypothetical protein